MWTMPSRKVSSLDKQKRIWKLTFFWCCQFPISQGENLDSVDGSYDDTHDTGLNNSLTSFRRSVMQSINKKVEKLFIQTKTISLTCFLGSQAIREWWAGGGIWSFWHFINLSLVLYWLLSSWIPCDLEVPFSSNVSPVLIIEGGLNLINSLSIPLGRACAA